MPDDPDETTEVELEAEPETDLRGAAGASAAKKARKERDEALREARDLKARLKKLEEADQSETERLRNELNELKDRDKEREASVTAERTDRERTERVRRAAKSLNFTDEDDTVALLRGHGLLEEIDDDADAERVLKRFAKDKPHLVRGANEENESLLDKVLNNGKPQNTRDQAPAGPGVKSGEEMYAMTDADFLAWRHNDPEGYKQSLEGWTGSELAVKPNAPVATIRQ